MVAVCQALFIIIIIIIISYIKRPFFIATFRLCVTDDPSAVGCCPQQGPYDPTTATSMKTSLKSRLCILLDVFAIIRIRPVTQKKGILVGAEEWGPRPSSDGDGRSYRLVVPALK